MGGIERRRRGCIKKGQYYKSNRLFFFFFFLLLLGYFFLRQRWICSWLNVAAFIWFPSPPRSLLLFPSYNNWKDLIYLFIVPGALEKKGKMIRYCVCTYTAVHFDVFIVSSLLLPLYSACWYKMEGGIKASPFPKKYIKNSEISNEICVSNFSNDSNFLVLAPFFGN
jgi:hypothetical protein